MTNQERELILRVVDGVNEALPLAHNLYNYRRHNEMYVWLINSGLTGKNFIEWNRVTFGRSPMSMAQFIIARLEKQKEIRPVLYGRDIM